MATAHARRLKRNMEGPIDAGLEQSESQMQTGADALRSMQGDTLGRMDSRGKVAGKSGVLRRAKSASQWIVSKSCAQIVCNLH